MKISFNLRRRLYFLMMVLSLSKSVPAWSTAYYVSTTGNDANSGTSSSPWNSISKANGVAFQPGDILYFEGGQTFSGTLQINASDGGSATNPVLISSYGTGRATLHGGAGSGIRIDGATGIRVYNLNIVGLGRKTGNSWGVGINLLNAQNITIDAIEASGFQYAGVNFDGSTEVRITNVVAHDNGYAGICSGGPISTNAYVGYCKAMNNPGDPAITDNHSGNGIVLVNVSNAVIEYCEAAGNGWDMQQSNVNGPCGIWTASSDRVTIQYCIAHNNTSTKLDGGGFDFDGGVTNSVMQYNYAYENKNYGFLLYEYGSSIRWTNNTVRYNISVNNTGPGLDVGTSGGQGVNDCQIYNNLFYTRSYPAIRLTLYSGTVSNLNIRNNILTGSSSASLVPTHSAFTYQGNCYWFPNGGFNIGNYASLPAWANATGQEKLNTILVGLHANPLLRDPDNYEKLTDPAQLPQLTAFLLPSYSPVLNKGLNLSSAFSINPGTRDFYGASIPYGSFDIGAQEFQGPATVPPFVAYPVTNPGFEADNASVQSPQDWLTWAGSQGTSANADYSEANGEAHSGMYQGTHWKNSAYEVYTYQVVNGLANGTYTLKAWVKSSGGQTYNTMEAKDYGGAKLLLNLPTTSSWQQISISNIQVVNGQCTIGFYSLASGGQWCNFDDVEFYRQDLVSNPGFEADNTSVQSPQGWLTWAGSQGTSANADYSEANGEAHSGTYQGTHWKNSAYEVSTYQTLTDLANGTYTLKAWVKSSGGQTYNTMEAKEYGGTKLTYSLPASGTWQQISIPNIQVSNGQCTVSFYSLASAGQWCNFDDIEFYRQSPARISSENVASWETNEMLLYPNPVKQGESFTIRGISSGNEQPVRVAICDLTGKILHQQMFNPHSQPLLTFASPLSRGSYLVRVQMNKGFTVKKLIVH